MDTEVGPLSLPPAMSKTDTVVQLVEHQVGQAMSSDARKRVDGRHALLDEIPLTWLIRG